VIILKRKEIHAVIHAFAKEYKIGGRKKKTLLLNQLEQTTGYYRKHLIEFLANPPQRKQNAAFENQRRHD